MPSTNQRNTDNAATSTTVANTRKIPPTTFLHTLTFMPCANTTNNDDTTKNETKRNVTAGNEAAGEILRENPDACVECHPLDLASFSSVRSFAKRTKGAPVSAIIHNAGVMAPPYSTTVDGHELTFQVRANIILSSLLIIKRVCIYRVLFADSCFRGGRFISVELRHTGFKAQTPRMSAERCQMERCVRQSRQPLTNGCGVSSRNRLPKEGRTTLRCRAQHLSKWPNTSHQYCMTMSSQ